MADKLILTWQDIEDDCKKVSQSIKLNINIIVAITKGGLPIATILANKYLQNPPIITLQLKEIKTEGQSNYQARQVKLISPLNSLNLINLNVLIVDDVADSGSTLKKTIEMVKKKNPQNILTACLHYKPRTHTKPQIFAKIIKNTTWIVYPWE